MIKDFDLKYRQHTVSGHTYHHLQLPNISFDSLLKANLNRGTDKIVSRLLSVPTHLYWEQEEDYLLIANLPQILMDRHNASPSIPANLWIDDKQRMDPEGTLLMVSAVNKGIPESVYRMQLAALSYLGDLTERPVDLFKLPTPREAKLPAEGSYGLKLTSSDTQLAIELNYENNPFELFGGSTYLSTAIAGMIGFAGISAIEEYETRQVRTKLIPGIAAAKKAGAALAEYKEEYGEFPDQAGIKALEINRETALYSLEVEANTGKVTIEFTVAKLVSGRDTLTLEPPSDGSSGWTCSSDIKSDYLPKSCR